MYDIDKIGLLLVYNQDYFLKTELKFREILSKAPGRSLLIIITNNPNIVRPDNFDGIFINGNNEDLEFGGWQTGLDYVKKNLSLQSIKAFIFANDTFCSHRPLTYIQKNNYIKGIKDCMDEEKPCIYGPLSSIGNEFELNGVQMASWICTYFYVINKKTMRDLLNLSICPSTNELNEYFGSKTNEDKFFSDQLDPVLKKHLIGWLFGRKNHLSWYKSQSLNQSNYNMMYMKACSILREKLLTTNITKQGGAICSIPRALPDRLLGRINRWCMCLRRPCKKSQVPSLPL